MRLSPRIGLGVLLSLSVACEGPEGPLGPQGPQGEQGVQGVQGEQGDPGTANVYYSEWTPFVSSNWSDPYSRFGQMRRDYPIDEPLIDEDILDAGHVAVYVRIPGNTGETVFALPWVLHIVKGLQQMLNFELHPGQIVINFFDLVDDSVDPGTFGNNVEHRYVVIPGGVPTSAGLSDLTDYESVIKHFGIEP